MRAADSKPKGEGDSGGPLKSALKKAVSFETKAAEATEEAEVQIVVEVVKPSEFIEEMAVEAINEAVWQAGENGEPRGSWS